jgi:hypothetical protein
MKEPQRVCKTCKFYEQLPFTDQKKYCMNPDSEYAECESEDNDTCDSWEGNEQ